MHVLPQQRQSLARVLSSVCFTLFFDALNNPVKRLKISASYIFRYTGFAQSVSKHAVSSSVFPHRNAEHYHKYAAELHYKYMGNQRSLARNAFSLWLRTNDEKLKVVVFKLYKTSSDFDLRNK